MISNYTEKGNEYVVSKYYLNADTYFEYEELKDGKELLFHTVNERKNSFLELGLNDFEKDDKRFQKLPKILVKQIVNSIEAGAELLHIYMR